MKNGYKTSVSEGIGNLWYVSKCSWGGPLEEPGILLTILYFV